LTLFENADVARFVVSLAFACKLDLWFVMLLQELNARMDELAAAHADLEARSKGGGETADDFWSLEELDFGADVGSAAAASAPLHVASSSAAAPEVEGDDEAVIAASKKFVAEVEADEAEIADAHLLGAASSSSSSTTLRFPYYYPELGTSVYDRAAQPRAELGKLQYILGHAIKAICCD